jgi:hypothetical protein
MENVLYLIGGTSRSGKSIVSKIILKKAGVAYLPLDSVVMAFTRGFPHFGIHDKLYPDEIAKRLWPFTKALLENLISVGDDYVVEGEALLPGHARQLMKRYGRQIRCCFLGYSEIQRDEKIRLVKAHAEGPQDWLLAESDAAIAQHIQNMIHYSRSIRRECKRRRVRYFDVSGNFKGAIQRIVRHLMEAS